MDHDYRALPGAGGMGEASVRLHLIREDSEATLCGIPRAALDSGPSSGELVCAECVEWLPKRKDFSGRHPRV